MTAFNKVDEIIAERQLREREAVEARIASVGSDPLLGRLVDSTTCPHDFFTNGQGQCSNCGTYVGLPR